MHLEAGHQIPARSEPARAERFVGIGVGVVLDVEIQRLQRASRDQRVHAAADRDAAQVDEVEAGHVGLSECVV
jgi:hypothetical protein